jgi:hypothetical protein
MPAEKCQMAWPLLALHDLLVTRDLRQHALLAWSANHTFGSSGWTSPGSPTRPR